MAERYNPYGNYNFLVSIGGLNDPRSAQGGFTEVSGLQTELTVAEYRNGNDPENHVRKVPGLHKVGDITLKRGLINSADLWAWIDDVRSRGYLGQRDVTITLNDETGASVQAWTLTRCIPLKYTGPTFNAKGDGDVALEELTLSAEGIALDSRS